MMVTKLKTISSRLVCFLALAALATSCLKEDSEDCDITLPLTRTFTITARAFDNQNNELTASEAREVRLFVFDSNKCFTQYIDTQVGQSVTLVVPEDEEVHVVGWSNLESSLQSYTLPAVGTHKDNILVSLLPDTRSSSFAYSPDDLFLGEISITAVEQEGAKTLPMYRQIGSMTITVVALKDYVGLYDDDEYRVVVHETSSQIDFSGNLSGPLVAYRQQGSFVFDANDRENYYVPPFNMVPASSGIYIEIYYSTMLCATVKYDDIGSAITVSKGELTEVVIRFTDHGFLMYPAEVTVSVSRAS